MILLTAVFFGISAGCVAWFIIRAQQGRRLLGSRLSEVPGMSFPYNVYEAPSAAVKRSFDATLGKSGRDKIGNDLFIAGLRQQKNVRFFLFLIKLSVIVPIGLVLLYAVTGSLNLKNLLVAGIVGLILYFYVRLTIRMLKQRRQRQILRSLPQFLDLIVVCVETGLSFTAALERILKELDPKAPLTQEFSVMYHEYLGGLPLAQAYDRLDKRCQVPDLSTLLSAIVQSDEMGGGLGATLRTQAAELRDKLRQRIRTRAYQIPVKILFPMMLIFLAFMMLNLGYIGYQMGVIVGGQTAGKSARMFKSQGSSAKLISSYKTPVGITSY